MKLWLDADAAPRDVKDVCYRASDRLGLETVLVANQRLQLPLGSPLLSAVRVDGGPDVAGTSATPASPVTVRPRIAPDPADLMRHSGSREDARSYQA